MNFSFIFVGSTHGFIDDFTKQRETIESVNPEFVLCEELENLTLDSEEKFNEFFKKREISNMTSFGEVEKLARLCFNKKIKLIGIDFHNFGLSKNLQRKIKNQEELKKEEEEEINKLLKLRENLHLSKILEWGKKSSRSIVVIIGCWHLRDESLIREKLRDYKIILPCDKNGSPLFAPTEDKEVKYTEVTSNEPKNTD